MQQHIQTLNLITFEFWSAFCGTPDRVSRMNSSQLGETILGSQIKLGLHSRVRQCGLILT